MVSWMKSMNLVRVRVYICASLHPVLLQASIHRLYTSSPIEALSMDTIGGDAGGEWSSLCGLLTTEEAEFMAQLLGFSSSNWAEMGGNSSFGGVPTSLWPAHESGKNEEVGNAASFYANAGTHSESSFGLLSDSNSSMEMEFLVVDDAANTTSCYLNIDPDDCLSQGTSDDNVRLELKRPSEALDPKPKAQERSTKIPELPNKRSRNSGNVQNGKRSLRPKKKQRNALTDKEEEDHDAGFNGQSPSSCSSEDDVNRSQELSGVAASGCSLKEQPGLNSKGKARAGRGAAADPQSIYARKRRERINERLRTLQNLVPNGTKVDISTMLEEAVQYVKFLQLQIKLLSSDDLWMYAPIAYNGVDIGLDLRLTLPKRTS